MVNFLTLITFLTFTFKNIPAAKQVVHGLDLRSLTIPALHRPRNPG